MTATMKRFWRCRCGQWNAWSRLVCLVKGCGGKKADRTEEE